MSLFNQKWEIKNSLENDKNIVEALLENRNISDYEDFLNVDFYKLVDPFLMKNMEEVINKIENTKENRSKVMICGDYDVDGVTSAVLLKDILEMFGIDVEVTLPHRVDDGYGLNTKHITEFHEKDIKLIITVDNGISAHEAVKKANGLGMSVVIMDHHTPQDILPDALILNPLVDGCKYPDKCLCGVGIVYKFLQAMGIRFPDIFSEAYIKWQLDLVALGTVADCAELVDENRIFVTYDLKVINQTKRFGLKKLIDFSNLKSSKIVSSDIGFKIGPKINAAGRLDSAMKAFDVLDGKENEPKLLDKVFELQDLNTKRQDLLNKMILESYSYIDTGERFIFVKKDDWHLGVVGLVAGYLARDNAKPAIVMAKKGSKITASIRMPEVDLNIMDVLKANAELFDKFGGHKSAAGFTIKEENLDDLYKGIKRYFDEKVSDEELEVKLNIDLELKPDLIDFNLISELSVLEPFGVGNPEPVFLLKNINIKGIKTVGAKRDHVKLMLESGGKSFSAIAFNYGKYINDLNTAMNNQTSVDIVFSLKVNEWNGIKSIDLHIMDMDLKIKD